MKRFAFILFVLLLSVCGFAIAQPGFSPIQGYPRNPVFDSATIGASYPAKITDSVYQNGYVWTVDGSGNVSFQPAPSGTVSSGTSAGQIPLWSGSAWGATSTITFKDTSVTAAPAPVITTVGTPGSTSYTYVLAVVLNDGRVALSAPTTISTGNAVLDTNNYNSFAWAAYPGGGVFIYFIYRTSSGGTPSTTGMVGVASAGSYVWADKGSVKADGINTPSRSQTGLGQFDIVRVGNYASDPVAKVGVEGSIGAHGSVRATGVDDQWFKDGGVELQYLPGYGMVMSFDRDTGHFDVLTLNYGGTPTNGPVLIGKAPNGNTTDFLQISGNTIIQNGIFKAQYASTNFGGATHTGVWGTADLYDPTDATSGVGTGNGGSLTFSGVYNASGTRAVFGAISGTKDTSAGGSANGQLSLMTSPSGSPLREVFNLNHAGRGLLKADNVAYNSYYGQFYVANSTDPNLQVYMGFDTAKGTYGSGYMQVADLTHSAMCPLILNPLGGPVQLPSAGITVVNSGTGITLNEPGKVTRQTYQITLSWVPYAAGAGSKGVVIATLPAKTRLVAAYADTTSAYGGGTISAVSLAVGTVSQGAADIIASHDVKTAVTTKGLADADMGTAMTRAALIQSAFLPSWSGTTAIYATISTTNGNTNALTSGVTTFYLITERL